MVAKLEFVKRHKLSSANSSDASHIVFAYSINLVQDRRNFCC